MKVLYCAKCGDIRSFAEITTFCHCENMAARWLDPRAGTVKVRAKLKQFAFIIGMHNSMLHAARDTTLKSHTDWAEKQRKILSEAEGYIFHEKLRNSWACIVRPGVTNDIAWEDDDKPYYKIINNTLGYTAYLREDLNVGADFVCYIGEVFNPNGKLIKEIGGVTPEGIEAAASDLIKKSVLMRPDQ